MTGKSKAFGNLFESIFKRTCETSGCVVTRIPDGCRQVGKNIIRVKSPFDWIVTYKSKTALIDTKTLQGNAFTSSMITDHQLNELIKHEKAGTTSGYVIWFRKLDEFIFVRASILLAAKTIGYSIKSDSQGVIFLGKGQLEIKQIFYNWMVS